jgi:hypothetical protein
MGYSPHSLFDALERRLGGGSPHWLVRRMRSRKGGAPCREFRGLFGGALDRLLRRLSLWFLGGLLGWDSVRRGNREGTRLQRTKTSIMIGMSLEHADAVRDVTRGIGCTRPGQRHRVDNDCSLCMHQNSNAHQCSERNTSELHRSGRVGVFVVRSAST